MMCPGTLTAEASRPSRLDWVVAGLLAAAVLVFYAATAGRSVAFDHGDAAQFQAMTIGGGIAHQPYPLWIVLLQVIGNIPIGEAAFRANLLSSFIASCAVGLLMLLSLRITGDRLASVGAAVAFGLSHDLWANACIAEVYSLCAALFVVLVLLLLSWLDEPSRPGWFALVLVFGTTISYHQLFVFVVPALIVVMWKQRFALQRMMSVRFVLATAAVFLLPFTLFLYTALVRGNPHALNWYDTYGRYVYAAAGHDSPYEPFYRQIWFQMWAARYGSFVQTQTIMVERVVLWVRNVVSLQFPFIGAALIPLGWVLLWRRNRALLVILTLLAAASVFVAVNYLSGGTTYAIPAYGILALCIGAALRWVRGSGQWWRNGLVFALIVLMSAASVSRHMSGSAFSTWLRSESGIADAAKHRGTFWHLFGVGSDGREFSEDMQSLLPRGSAIFADWGEANVLHYQQRVHHGLEGVRIHYVYPDPEQIASAISSEHPTAVFMTIPPESVGFAVDTTLTVRPGRLVFRVDLEMAASESRGTM